jgi:hypothetical protein
MAFCDLVVNHGNSGRTCVSQKACHIHAGPIGMHGDPGGRPPDGYPAAHSVGARINHSTVVICHARVSMLPLDPAEYAD